MSWKNKFDGDAECDRPYIHIRIHIHTIVVLVHAKLCFTLYVLCSEQIN